jgi:hypothetical protein
MESDSSLADISEGMGEVGGEREPDEEEEEPKVLKEEKEEKED